MLKLKKKKKACQTIIDRHSLDGLDEVLEIY